MDVNECEALQVTRNMRCGEGKCAQPPALASPLEGPFLGLKARNDMGKANLLEALMQQLLQSASVLRAASKTSSFVPISVNWHYTRECNYSCKFCFHTAKSSFFLPSTPSGMLESKHCLSELQRHGMKKLNFSGGEPFLHPKELGELCRFCKVELGLESVSIVSNGSKIRRSWLAKFGRFVDILAVSCDSFVEETNISIGRGKGMHLSQLSRVREWCYEFKVPFKLNSVINIHNVNEDMIAAITQLNPVRWKVFQCLLLDGENAGEGALRAAAELVITDEQFDAFVQRHETLECLVPENNQNMKDSYLILDEELRFLNCTGGAKVPSRSIRDVSVPCALKEAGFDADMFVKRGGIYNWSRPAEPPVADVEDLGEGCGPVRPGEWREEDALQGPDDDRMKQQQKMMLMSVIGSGVLLSLMCAGLKFKRHS